MDIESGLLLDLWSTKSSQSACSFIFRISLDGFSICTILDWSIILVEMSLEIYGLFDNIIFS